MPMISFVLIQYHIRIFECGCIFAAKMLSKASEYAIKAMIYIMSETNKNLTVNIGEISGAIKSPTAFTAKILQKLSKDELLDSLRGPSGGYSILKHRIKDMTLKDIIIAIDGDALFNACGLGLEECNNQKPCPMHNKYKKVRESFDDMFSTTKLIELTEGLNSETRLKI